MHHSNSLVDLALFILIDIFFYFNYTCYSHGRSQIVTSREKKTSPEQKDTQWYTMLYSLSLFVYIPLLITRCAVDISYYYVLVLSMPYMPIARP